MSAIRPSRIHQRGSALLIVFVFAAILAITLFTEMPVVIFEAQRNKEQLLMDRGNEYSQAVKLYLRKTGQYPPSIAALENTNRIRYLRKRFKDPFTDKDDWRLLHAGPNGMLLDSKIKTAVNGPAAGSPLGTFNNNNGGQTSPFGATSPGNTGFGSGGFNSGPSAGGNANAFGAGNSNGFGANNSANNGFGANNSANGGFGGNRSPYNSGGFNASNGAGNPNFPGGVASNAEGIDPNVVPGQRPSGMQPNGNPAQPQMTNPDGTVSNLPASQRAAFPTGTNGSATGVIDPNQPSPNQTGAVASGGFASSSGPSNGTQSSGAPNNPNAAVGGFFSNPNPATPQTNQSNGFNNASGPSSAFGGGNTFSSSNGQGNANGRPGFGSSTFGSTQGGGSVAGVASKAERHSIKIYNEQQDYSLWEFYYDPNKDPARNAAGAALSQNGGGTNQPGNSMPGQQNTFNNQSTPFGSQTGNNGANSGFGNFGGGLSNSPNQNGQNQNGLGQNPRTQSGPGTGFGSAQQSFPQQSFPQQNTPPQQFPPQ